MDLIAKDYLQSISHIVTMAPEASDMRMFSSVTGQHIDHTDLGPEYWVKNLTSPVLFSDAVRGMSRKLAKSRRHGRKADPAIDFFLEVGPHAALKGPLRQVLESEALSNIGYSAMLVRGQNAVDSAVLAAGALASRGVRLDFNAVNNANGPPRVLVGLPSYPWNKSHSYWAVSRQTNDFLKRRHPHHSLLGCRVIGTHDLEPTWRHFLSVAENPWIRDHVVHGAILYPGAGILVMPIEAAQQLAEDGRKIKNVRLRSVRIQKALIVADEQTALEVFTRLKRHGDTGDASWSGCWEFSIFSCQDGQPAEENGSGLVNLEYEAQAQDHLMSGSQIVHQARKSRFDQLQKSHISTMTAENFYRATSAVGLAYGTSFQGVTELTRGGGSCCCVVKVPDTRSVMPGNVESGHLIHPTTLDSMIHCLFAALNDGPDFRDAAVPVAFDSVVVSATLPSGPNAQFQGFATVTRTASREIEANVYMSCSAWKEPRVQIEGMRCRELPVGRTSYSPSELQVAPIGTLTWKPDIDLLDEDALRSFIASHYSARRFSISPQPVSTTAKGALTQLHQAIAQVRLSL